MNWDAIGAVGQAISALALVVVIVQVRLNAAETLRSIRQDRRDDERRSLLENAQSPWLASVITKVDKAFDRVVPPAFAELMERGLTAEEVSTFITYVHSWWLFDEQQIEHIDKLTSGERARFDAVMRIQYQTIGWKRWFLEQGRSMLNADAVRYIDNLLAQPN